MSGLGSIKIELEQDAYDVFMATRLTRCMAFKCKNHETDDARCLLRHIAIDETGKCEQFERKEE